MKMIRNALIVMGLIIAMASVNSAAQSAAQVQSTAKQAYIYGFPMVDFYRIMFAYFIDPKSPAYTAPFNQLYNRAQVYTPKDTTVQTPNSDTPYSSVGLDLRAEPIVLTLPAIAKDRYYSVQFVDEYTFNIAYAGSRTTGNGGGTFLIVGPSWHGTTPPDITKVIQFDTDFGLALIRTQLFGPSDLDNVRNIQAGYKARPLSEYLHQPTPAAPPAVQWIAPLPPPAERTSPGFFNVLAFVLHFCPVAPSEAALRKSFADIGIVPGEPFVPGSEKPAYIAGMNDGQAQIDATRAQMTSSRDLFGTREALKDNYVNRAVGAQWGILGNSAAEAIYLTYAKDANGQPLLGTSRYTVTFAKGSLPPVNAFWSLTMYDLPQQLLVANPINRYLINSPMLPNLKRNVDGGLTLYIQRASPGKDKESNWLPAPAGPFMMVLRLYWPKESALTGQWVEPPAMAAK